MKLVYHYNETGLHCKQCLYECSMVGLLGVSLIEKSTNDMDNQSLNSNNNRVPHHLNTPYLVTYKLPHYTATYYFGDVPFFLEHRGAQYVTVWLYQMEYDYDTWMYYIDYRNTRKRTVVLKTNDGTPEKHYVFWKTLVIGTYTMPKHRGRLE
ncbi:hypothetical protein BC941DRAFT_474595 [Chlamydoabsidia padenii]|nr:hypothetical protein BC941DRAFT_474595 [Chlamydoabsidia padenii]